MAVVDPYAPCPCGSGEKFKWCCQKVESYAERAQRLHENGQYDAALEVLEEGLRKAPDNAWLLMRKAIILSNQHRPEQAAPVVRRVVAARPDHLGAQMLLIRLVLQTEGMAAGAAQLQQALSACPPGRRASLAPMVRVVGAILAEGGYFASALAHLDLALRLGAQGDDASAVATARQMVLSNAAIGPWLKDTYRLAPAPEGLDPARRARFDEALRWGEDGLWASSASAFETLAADGVGPEADRNAGLGRLWMVDHAGAVAALGRYVARAGETTEAVDLEALRQLILPASQDDLVERVRLIWPVRDRAALLAALRGSDVAVEAGRVPLDEDDENSPEVDAFVLLDRPHLTRTADVRAADVPRILARLLVGLEIVALEALDDERLDATKDRFTALAGEAIPPAQPRTKVVDQEPRSSQPFLWEWLLPDELPEADARRVEREERSRALREVWPGTPMPYLGGRTPLQAARAGDARTALRAAVFRMQVAAGVGADDPDFAAVRETLGIPPEPAIDPETVDIAAVPLARLHLIPADRLDDDRLVALFQRARQATESLALDRAARALVGRPALFEGRVDLVTVYSQLASQASVRGDAEEALDWVRRGRQADPGPQRARHAPYWDLLEVRLRTRTEPPEAWVPDLAVVLERYQEDQDASQAILVNLVSMGLVQMVPHPDDPDSLLFDTRPLQALLARYGPRVTTASGRLGVAASKGEIWTPGSPAAGGGGIWTPGASAGPAPSGEKSKIIVTGR